MRYLYMNRCSGLGWLASTIVSALLLLPGIDAGEEDASSEFQLLTHSFSSGGVPAGDGEVMLTACSIGGLVGTSRDEMLSIDGGDLVPLVEAGAVFLDVIREGNELRLSWDATGPFLEHSESFSSSMTWTSVTGADTGYFLVPLDAGQGFFRLRDP